MIIVETETFPVTFNMPKQRVWDLLCCGMESGSYGSFEIQGYEPRAKLDSDSEQEFRGYGEYPHIDTPFQGGAVLMKDKYGDEPTVYRLTLDALKRGLKILGEKYPHMMADFINENEDVITGDAFIQCALLGYCIYG
jgi:hypothetical protein